MFAPLNSLIADPADPTVGGIPAGIAEVEGEPITARHLRAFLTAIDSVCPGGLQAPTGGSLHLEPPRSRWRSAGHAEPAARWNRQFAAAAGSIRTATADAPSSHVHHPLRSYRPTAAQRRWVRARDQRCRHPGCRNKVGWADLDHVVPHAEGGVTGCANLCCLCRRHHRLKTHAYGWVFRLDADGALLVTTPSGVTRISRPPGLAWLEPYELGALPPGVAVIDPRAVLNDRAARTTAACARMRLPMSPARARVYPSAGDEPGPREDPSCPSRSRASGSTAPRSRRRSTTPRSSPTPRSATSPATGRTCHRR